MTPDFAHMTVADALRYAAKRARADEHWYRMRSVARHDSFHWAADVCGVTATNLENDARRAERQRARRK